jgi:hypothetical protein
MRRLSNAGYDPNKLLQTYEGTAEALSCGRNTAIELANAGKLERLFIDNNKRLPRITTQSIRRLIEARAAAGTSLQAAAPARRRTRGARCRSAPDIKIGQRPKGD